MKSKAILKKSFHEVFEKEPKVVANTRAKKGEKAAAKQKVAIALSKARKSGARASRKG